MLDKILQLKIPIVLFFCPILVVLSSSLLIDEHLINTDPTSFQVLEMIRKTPMALEFYFFIAILLGLFLSWYSYLYIKLQKDFEAEGETKKQHALDPSVLDVYRRFRERAFALRTGASITLISVFFLLFGGLYFIFFILLPLKAYDSIQLEESVLQATFVERFGDKLRSMDGGRYWFTANGIQHSEKNRVSLLVFGGDDGCYMGNPKSRKVDFVQNNFGYIAYENGDVFLTKNGGQSWAEIHLKLNSDDYINKAAVDDNGRTALFVSSHGSVFRIVDDKIQRIDTLEYDTKNSNMREKTAHLCLNMDGDGLILGDNGSIFITSNGGKSWASGDSPTKLSNSNQRLLLANRGFTRNGLGLLEFHPLDDHGLINHNSLDTIFVTDDFAKSWKAASFPEKSSLADHDSLDFVRLHENKLGLAVTNSGSVLATDDAGKNWKMSFEGNQLNTTESMTYSPIPNEIIFADLNKKGAGLILTNKGSLFYKETSGKVWINRESIFHDWNSNRLTSIADYKFSDDFVFGLVISSDESIFLTKNSGISWELVDTLSRYPEQEFINVTSIALNNNKQSLIKRSPSEIFITDDFTTNWDSTEWDVEPSRIDYLIGVTHDGIIKNAITMAVDNDGKVYFLKKSAEVAGWENKPTLNFTKDLSKFPHIKNSNIYQRVEAFVADYDNLDTGNTNQQTYSDKANQGLLGILLDDLLISRTITMIFLFFFGTSSRPFISI